MLLDMRELQGAHNGVGIVRVIIEIMVDWEIDPIEIGVGVSDNASSNDTTMKEVGSQLFLS